MSDTKPKYEFKNIKVSRLPPLPEPLDPIVTDLFEDTANRGGSILNLHLTKAHAPKLQAAGRHITRALRSECDSPRVLREIAILRASILVGCAYEAHHHSALAAAAGLTQEQVDAVKGEWRPKAKLFDDKQQALLAYVDQLGLNKGDVDDATFAGMEKHFSPQEIVELTMCATSYYGGGIFMKAMRIQLDDPHKKAAPGKF
jgi:4-carboxymuconolactone decarboxylase